MKREHRQQNRLVVEPRLLLESRFAPLQISLDVRFRLCERGDLRKLEWEGLFHSDRRVIEAAFRKQERGRNIMLLAEANGRAVGQVWIDLEKHRPQGAALVWAMRVIPWLQGQGMGRRLLEAASGIALDYGFPALELEVDCRNLVAQRLYSRSGFEPVRQVEHQERYTTRRGRTVLLRRPRLLMKKLLQPNERPRSSRATGRRSPASLRSPAEP
jgi:ribosomal protein S18 acetylase RimI-like enzyme